MLVISTFYAMNWERITNSCFCTPKSAGCLGAEFYHNFLICVRKHYFFCQMFNPLWHNTWVIRAGSQGWLICRTYSNASTRLIHHCRAGLQCVFGIWASVLVPEKAGSMGHSCGERMLGHVSYAGRIRIFCYDIHQEQISFTSSSGGWLSSVSDVTTTTN